MNQQLRKPSQSAMVRAQSAAPGAISYRLAGCLARVRASQLEPAQAAGGSIHAGVAVSKAGVMVFTPVMPNPATKLTLLRRLLKKYRYCGPLSKRLTEIYRDRNYARTAEELARDELLPEKLSRDEIVGLTG